MKDWYTYIEDIIIALFTAERLAHLYLEQMNKRKSYLPRINQDAKIHTALSELQKDVGSDRILVFKMHNGGKYASGESINKISITQDLHDPSMPSVSQLFQNILFETIPNFVLRLTTQGKAKYALREDDPQAPDRPMDEALCRFMAMANIKYLYCLLVVKKRKPVGCIAVCLNNENKALSTSDKARIATIVQNLQDTI